MSQREPAGSPFLCAELIGLSQTTNHREGFRGLSLGEMHMHGLRPAEKHEYKQEGWRIQRCKCPATAVYFSLLGDRRNYCCCTPVIRLFGIVLFNGTCLAFLRICTAGAPPQQALPNSNWLCARRIHKQHACHVDLAAGLRWGVRSLLPIQSTSACMAVVAVGEASPSA